MNNAAVVSGLLEYKSTGKNYDSDVFRLLAYKRNCINNDCVKEISVMFVLSRVSQYLDYLHTKVLA